MEFSDIDAGLSLCRSAKWNQLQTDWEIFLHLSPGGCRVASSANKVIGTVTTVRYQHFFSWIGMVLVDLDYRRQGIGIQLLEEALEILRGEETVKLDATPAGREVYLKLNFVDEYRLSRMNAIVDVTRLESSYARPLQKKDLESLIIFDREIFGAGRQSLLEWMWEASPRYAFIIKEENSVQGYCLGRQGYNYTHIGPVIADNFIIAKDLVSAALRNCIGKSVILDVLHFDNEWLSWLGDIGFREQRPFIRMYRGTNAFNAVPEKQFAILGPEFG
ncbi:MAG: GNAT family N-acetyltransferase [Bacteroidota bacterium]